MFATVDESADALTKLGATGTKVAYRGPGTVDKSAVTETTSGGPTVKCWAATSVPVTGASAAAKLPAGDFGFAPLASILGPFGLGAAFVSVRKRPSEDAVFARLKDR